MKLSDMTNEQLAAKRAKIEKILAKRDGEKIQVCDKEGALTVGDVKRALASVPDDVAVGQSVCDITGYVTRVTQVLYFRKTGVVSFDSDRHVGCFTEDEMSEEGEIL